MRLLMRLLIFLCVYGGSGELIMSGIRWFVLHGKNVACWKPCKQTLADNQRIPKVLYWLLYVQLERDISSCSKHWSITENEVGVWSNWPENPETFFSVAGSNWHVERSGWRDCRTVPHFILVKSMLPLRMAMFCLWKYSDGNCYTIKVWGITCFNIFSESSTCSSCFFLLCPLLA